MTDQDSASKLASIEERKDWRGAMQSKAVRRIMWRILSESHLFSLSFSLANPDPILTAFKEGERNRGLAILDQIQNHAPGSYDLMRRENTEDQQRENDE